jgi:hypothetical protein
VRLNPRYDRSVDVRVEERRRRSTASGLRLALAAVVYTVGGVGCLALAADRFVEVADGASPWTLVSLVGVLIPWWITAGIGVRLGLTPRAYARGVARVLGF